MLSFPELRIETVSAEAPFRVGTNVFVGRVVCQGKREAAGEQSIDGSGYRSWGTDLGRRN
jgi:hypothetical protein